MAATTARQGHQFHRQLNHKKQHPGPAILKGLSFTITFAIGPVNLKDLNITITFAIHPNPSCRPIFGPASYLP
jgi:hypothetical protein